MKKRRAPFVSVLLSSLTVGATGCVENPPQNPPPPDASPVLDGNPPAVDAGDDAMAVEPDASLVAPDAMPQS